MRRLRVAKEILKVETNENCSIEINAGFAGGETNFRLFQTIFFLTV